MSNGLDGIRCRISLTIANSMRRPRGQQILVAAGAPKASDRSDWRLVVILVKTLEVEEITEAKTSGSAQSLLTYDCISAAERRGQSHTEPHLIKPTCQASRYTTT